jgi:hypothetical protein
MKTLLLTTAPLFALTLILGCGQSTESSAKKPSPEGQKYLLAAEPAGAKNVTEIRAAAKDDDEVVVVGRIGGSTEPWVKGMAAFTIGDVAVKACSELEGDTCPTPWDFCCERDLGSKIIAVKFEDENGEVIDTDARELFAVKELTTVVVRGKIKNDKDGVKLIANGMYVKK